MKWLEIYLELDRPMNPQVSKLNAKQKWCGSTARTLYREHLTKTHKIYTWCVLWFVHAHNPMDLVIKKKKKGLLIRKSTRYSLIQRWNNDALGLFSSWWLRDSCVNLWHHELCQGTGCFRPNPGCLHQEVQTWPKKRPSLRPWTKHACKSNEETKWYFAMTNSVLVLLKTCGLCWRNSICTVGM